MLKTHEERMMQGQVMAEKRKGRVERFVNNQVHFTPDANVEVLKFIGNFLWHGAPDVSLTNSCESIRHTFRAGYCFYFAVMLREAFHRGKICHAYPYSHIVWVDEDDIPYDIEGVYSGEAIEYRPVETLGDGISSFKHID